MQCDTQAGSGDSTTVKFCTNCKKDIAANNFTVHEARCARLVTCCPHCEQPFDKKELDQHIFDVHAKVDCPHCKEPISKSDVEKHIADVHKNLTCLHCNEVVNRNLMDKHIEDEHTKVTCPSCQAEVKKSLFDNHQKNECSKRTVACHFCNMLCVHSDSKEHEEYCGTRTEPCPSCGNFIMVRDAALHHETHCQYPPPEYNQRNNEDSPKSPGWFSFQSPFHRLHSELERSMNPYSVPSDMPRRDPFDVDDGIQYRSNHSRDDFDPSPFVRPIRHIHNNVSHPVVEIDSDNDADDDALPCEFCSKLYKSQKLIQHQTGCSLNINREFRRNQSNDSTVVNVDSSALEHDLHSLEPGNDEAAYADYNNKYAVYPEVDDPRFAHYDIDPSFKNPRLAQDRVETDAAEDFDGRIDIPSCQDGSTEIPCEFCLELFDLAAIADHQDLCYRQQTEALNGMLATGISHSEAAEQYRSPFNVMSIEQRERLARHSSSSPQDEEF